MNWKKNEIKILRKFDCPECKVIMFIDDEVDHRVYNAHCPRCKKEYIVKIIIEYK